MQTEFSCDKKALYAKNCPNSRLVKLEKYVKVNHLHTL